MTKDETVMIMAMLNAFYANGKGDPKAQASAWFLVLEKYDYNDAMRAVLRFAENDTRDYASFPAVGRIVQEIRAETAAKHKLIKDIIHSIAYGREYGSLSSEAQSLIGRDEYNAWGNMNAEVFSVRTDELADILNNKQRAIESGGSRYEISQNE